ncbi:hypothetical protein L1987_24764 [Smallanthus sonchifolius]|uniref:Uncharacterized protein n=1 Tax=Smallanthus sonchifolius TaxID=185202 RepID=A0ACB9IMP2_9ASTR|nr:hypothetical protein L1987_24764 [Smallanthus sonchifolius]
MKSDEGTGSLDTFIRQAVGKEPLFSFSRTGESPTQWIQLLHTFDQKDLPGWSLLAPMKVQMQKCDKCAREFCSTINYRRHIRVHRRSMNVHKEPQKYKDMLRAFWDKLDYDKAKEIMSFKDVNLEEVPGSSIVKNIAANLRKQNFLSLPQVYVKAGSALVDIIQGRPSRLIFSQELFSVLDDASERTFLCAGTAESLKKYVFDGEAGKIGLETKNLIACTSFLVEQKLVNAWLADKDAEALRCQKLLVEEEEAAQKRQAELLERKRLRKIRQKEQRARDQSDSMKVELYTVSDIFESASSAESSSHQISPVIDPVIPDENITTPLDPVQLSNYEEAIDHSYSTVNEQQKVNNSSQHFIARWQVPKSQRNDHHNNQNGKFLYTASDTCESVSSAENSSRQISPVINPMIPDENMITPLDPVQLSSYEEAISHSVSTVNEQQKINNSSQHFIARSQVPRSQRNGHHNTQNGNFLKREQPHKHREQRVNNGGKIWTKKPKPENGVKSRVHNDANNQTAVNGCQLMIGSISVTVRNSAGQYQVNSPTTEFQENENTEIKPKSVQNVPNRSNVKLWRARHDTRVQFADGNKSQMLEEVVTSARGVDQTLTTVSSHQSCELNVNDEGINDCSIQVEGGGELMPFSIDAAKDFLAQRWKEAISGDHVELVITSAPDQRSKMTQAINHLILQRVNRGEMSNPSLGQSPRV